MLTRAHQEPGYDPRERAAHPRTLSQGLRRIGLRLECRRFGGALLHLPARRDPLGEELPLAFGVGRGRGRLGME